MIKKVSTICLLLITLPHVVGTCFADTSSGDYWPFTQIQTYTLDTRRYLNGDRPSGAMHKKKWSDWPYSQIVKVTAPDPEDPSLGGVGTGTFISTKHVLTNKHVAECCGVSETSMAQHNCIITLHDGTKMLANVVMTGGSDGTVEGLRNKCLHTESDAGTGTDWAILELVSPDAIQSRGNEHLDLSNAPLNDNTPVDFRAGFGGLQILSDKQIRTIKEAYKEAFGTTEAETSTIVEYEDEDEDRKYLVEIEVEDAGLIEYLELTREDINEMDDAEDRIFFNATMDYYGRFLTRHREISRDKGNEEDFLDFFDDKELKIIENCSITQQYQTSFQHTCYAWSGDSGSALVTNDKVLGILTTGYDFIIGTKEECLTGDGCDFGIPAAQINTRATQHILDAALTAPEPTTTGANPDNAKQPKQPQQPQQQQPQQQQPQQQQPQQQQPQQQQPQQQQPQQQQPQQQQPQQQQPQQQQPQQQQPQQQPQQQQQQQPQTPTQMAPARQRNVAKNVAIATAATAAIAAAAVGINAANKNNKADKPKKNTPQAVAPQNKARAIGANCVANDMPANAERGEYVAVNIKKLDCNGQQCACVATKCKNGYKLVHKQINGKWESMGYCINPKPCTAGKHDIDIINDVQIIRQHGGHFCK